MYTFQEIYAPGDLDAYSDWQEIRSYDENNEVRLNGQGDVVTTLYQGRVYLFISQRIKEYSFAESTMRIALGILATIATLGLSLLSRAVRELFITGRKEIRFGEFLEDAAPGAIVNGHPGGLREFSLDLTSCHYGEKNGIESTMCEHICHYVDDDEEEQQGDLVLTGAEVRDCLQWLPKEIVDRIDQEHFRNIVIPL